MKLYKCWLNQIPIKYWCLCLVCVINVETFSVCLFYLTLHTTLYSINIQGWMLNQTAIQSKYILWNNFSLKFQPFIDLNKFSIHRTLYTFNFNENMHHFHPFNKNWRNIIWRPCCIITNLFIFFINIVSAMKWM